MPVVTDPPHERQQLLDHHRGQAERELVDHQQLGLGRAGPCPGPASAAGHRRGRRPARGAAGRGSGRARGPGPPRPRCPPGRPCAASNRPAGGSRPRSGTGTRPAPPGTWTMPRAAISWGGAWVMSRPSKTTAPRSASTTPQMALSRVDLPAPLVPSRATISPSSHLEVDAEEDLDVAVADVEVPDDQQHGLALAALVEHLGPGGGDPSRPGVMSSPIRSPAEAMTRPPMRKTGVMTSMPGADAPGVADPADERAARPGRGAPRASRSRSRSTGPGAGWPATARRGCRGRRWPARR